MSNGGKPRAARVCQLAAVPNDGTHVVSIELAGRRHPVILLRRGGIVLAYVNRCPHMGLSLNWLPNQFLDASGELLLCANHGALFRIENGLCVVGPCRGQSLLPLVVRVGPDGWIELALAD
jgi:nitrite reductase/ring-hydroxylating ferredoxin subunit